MDLGSRHVGPLAITLGNFVNNVMVTSNMHSFNREAQT
jgi:hypothetical protein